MSERPDKWYDERVEAWLDDELSTGEARLFEARLAVDPTLTRAVDQAREIQAALTDLPHYRCPTDLSRKVAHIAGARRNHAGRWLGLAAAACVGLLALGVLLQPETQAPSAREVHAARQELALALGYLDKAGSSAGRQVGERWINGVLRPVESGAAHAREETS